MKKDNIDLLEEYKEKNYLKLLSFINIEITKEFERNHNKKIILDDDLFNLLFMDETYENINGVLHEYWQFSSSIFDCEPQIKELLNNISKMIDFSKIDYYDQYINQEIINFMKKNNIPLNTKRIKDLYKVDLKGIIIQGSLDDIRIIEATNFNECKDAFISFEQAEKPINCNGLEDVIIIVPDSFDLKNQTNILSKCLRLKEMGYKKMITLSQYIKYLNKEITNLEFIEFDLVEEIDNTIKGIIVAEGVKKKIKQINSPSNQ